LKKTSSRGISKVLIALIALVIIVIAGVAAYLTKPAPAVISTPTSTPTAASPVTTPRPKTLTIWIQSYASSIDREKWEKVFKKFEEKTGINVKVVGFSAADLVAKFTSALEAGVPEALPDLVGWTTTFNVMWAVKGQLEPLDDIVDWIYKNWGDDVFDINFIMAKWPGPDGVRRYYSVSIGMVTQSLFVRQDVLEMCGLTLRDLETFDKFNRSLYVLRDCIKEKNLNMFPLDIQISTAAPTDGTYDYWLLWSIFSGSDPVDPEGKIYINASPRHVEAHAKVAELLTKWYYDGIISKAAFMEAEVDNNVNFLTGRSVMTPNGVASIYVQAVATHPEWKIAVIPLPGNPETGTPRRVLAEIRPFMIPAAIPKERKELAKEFLKFIFDRENYKEWYGNNGGFGWVDAPIYKSLLNSEPYISHPVWSGVREGILKGLIDPATIRPGFSVIHAQSLPMTTVGKAILGQITPKEAAEIIIKGIWTEVQRYG